MFLGTSRFRRMFLLPTILVNIHTALVAAASAELHLGSHGSWGAVPWFLLYYADYPASFLRRDFTTLAAESPVFFAVAGGLFWGLAGLALQSGWRGSFGGAAHKTAAGDA